MANTGFLAQPLWQSPFRPLYLLGALYCPLLMLLWLTDYTGQTQLAAATPFTLALWHGHEMIFGLFGAIVAGFSLTFLGSWAQIKELAGWRLLLLAILWISARLAIYLAPTGYEWLVAAIDTSFYFIISALVAPLLWRAPNRLYLLALIVFIGIGVGNWVFYQGLLAQDANMAALGLRIALYAIMLKFVSAGAFLTVVFSNNVVPQQGGKTIRFQPVIEGASILSTLFFIASDLLSMSSAWCATAAGSAAVIHLLRLSRWQSWRVRKHPLILIMHLAYLWLIATFLLRALHDWNGLVSMQLWLHAFTAGAMGLMGMSFMTRVVLRHTGRQPQPQSLMVFAFALLFIGALLRMLSHGLGFSQEIVALSGVLWALPFIIYLGLYAGMLWRPSLEKRNLPKVS